MRDIGEATFITPSIAPAFSSTLKVSQPIILKRQKENNKRLQYNLLLSTTSNILLHFLLKMYQEIK
jgi:hypothetical protein